MKRETVTINGVLWVYDDDSGLWNTQITDKELFADWMAETYDEWSLAMVEELTANGEL